MDDSKIISKLKDLVEEGKSLKAKLRLKPLGYIVEDNNKPYYQDGERWKGKVLNLLKLRFGPHSDYYLNFAQEINTEINGAGEYSQENVGKALGALEWVLDALESGLIEDLFYQKEILIFEDLLKQAYEFLEKGFDLIAAIYGRIVLETTIKEFANKNGITEDSFDQYIINLRKKGVINQPFEHSLRANYSTGSIATHGREEFSKLTKNEIKLFLDFIRDRVLTL